MDIEKGLIYFRSKGIIKVLEVPKFGSLEILAKDGEIYAVKITERKHY